MKKINLLLLVLVSLFACKQKLVNTTTFVSINEPFLLMGKGSVNVKITADRAVENDLHITFDCLGTAKKGQDYSVSSEEFIIAKGKKEAFITLSRLNIDKLPEADLSIMINLKRMGKDYTFGLQDFCSINLIGKKGNTVSFESEEGELSLNGSFRIVLKKGDGKAYREELPTEFEIEVDPSSTAVEGVHFEFPKGKKIIVPKRRNAGALAIKYLKKEENKDLLVLTIKTKEGFLEGDISKIQIKLNGAFNLEGEWQFFKFVSKDYVTSVGAEEDDLPVFSDKDILTIKGGDYKTYKLQVAANSLLKDYFGSDEKDIVFVDEEKIQIHEERNSFKYVSKYNVPDVNVNFSATNTSKRTAFVYMRIRKDIANQPEALELTMIDIEPKDGDKLSKLYKSLKWWASAPHYFSEAPIRLVFKRKV